MTSTEPRTTRLLTACTHCKRQYDVGSLAARSRFRCHCSEILEVPVFSPHDAAIVRCSSCGAPCTKDAASCRHCGADYTLAAKDLFTVCPCCMARLSDRARFCHWCATPILTQEEASRPSERRCPACVPTQPLHGRSFGERAIAMLECPRCAGLWLGRAEFDLVAERARTEALPDGVATSKSPAVVSPDAAAPAYRRCPYCAKHMNRRNFGRHSGVILDTCKDHGTWLDAHELDAVLRWIRLGGESASRERMQSEQRHAERQQRIQNMPEHRGGEFEPERAGLDVSTALEQLSSFLAALFGIRK